MGPATTHLVRVELKQVLRTEMKPNFMREYNNLLYLNCPDKGIYVFDIFGAFSRLIALKGLDRFQIIENIVYFRKDNNVCSYNTKLHEESCHAIHPSTSGDARREAARRLRHRSVILRIVCHIRCLVPSSRKFYPYWWCSVAPKKVHDPDI